MAEDHGAGSIVKIDSTTIRDGNDPTHRLAINGSGSASVSITGGTTGQLDNDPFIVAADYVTPTGGIYEASASSLGNGNLGCQRVTSFRAAVTADEGPDLAYAVIDTSGPANDALPAALGDGMDTRNCKEFVVSVNLQGAISCIVSIFGQQQTGAATFNWSTSYRGDFVVTLADYPNGWTQVFNCRMYHRMYVRIHTIVGFVIQLNKYTNAR